MLKFVFKSLCIECNQLEGKCFGWTPWSSFLKQPLKKQPSTFLFPLKKKKKKEG